MTDSANGSTADKIRALTEARRTQRRDREARQRERIAATIASGEALPSGRGGARANAGRKPLFADGVQLTPNLDDVTRKRIAKGDGKALRGPDFLRLALARLVGELDQDANLHAEIEDQMEHLDPALWVLPPGLDRPKMTSMLIAVPATLAAGLALFCRDGKLFRSISQMARVAVSIAADRPARS